MKQSMAFRRVPALAGALLALVLMVAGCATPQMTALERSSAGLPASAQISNVPFYPQEDYQCGPAALAMAGPH
jgi:hypothetical protein